MLLSPILNHKKFGGWTRRPTPEQISPPARWAERTEKDLEDSQFLNGSDFLFSGLRVSHDMLLGLFGEL